MTDLQRHQRAAFVREQPLLWFVLLYAAGFLGCAVANDVLIAWGATGLSSLARYLLPVAVALPSWLGLRGWSRRVIVGPSRAPAADERRAQGGWKR